MLRPVIASAAVCLAVWATPGWATILTVDDFSAGTADLNITAAAPPTQSASQLETGLAGVLGGSRNVLIQKLSGTSGGTRNVSGVVDAPSKEFAYISGNAVTGRLSLTYDANGAGLNVLLNPTLDSFAITFVNGDYSATRSISVMATITAANEQTGSLTQTLAVEASPIDLEFAISDFSNLLGLDLETTSVKALQFDFAPTAASTDFTLGSVEIVPEPAGWSSMLVGVSSCGWLAWWRLRRGPRRP